MVKFSQRKRGISGVRRIQRKRQATTELTASADATGFHRSSSTRSGRSIHLWSDRSFAMRVVRIEHCPDLFQSFAPSHRGDRARSCATLFKLRSVDQTASDQSACRCQHRSSLVGVLGAAVTKSQRLIVLGIALPRLVLLAVKNIFATLLRGPSARHSLGETIRPRLRYCERKAPDR